MRQSIKIVMFLLLNFSTLNAINYNKTTGNICLCPLPANTLQTKISYNRINDTIDVLNIKEQELGSNPNYGSIGDASGLDISLGYGINDFSALYYDYEYLSVHYADARLRNKKHDIFTKINLYHNKNNLFQTFSVDLGYVRNYANDINIKNISTLNSMVQKMRPGTKIQFDGQGIIYGNSALYIFDQNGIVVPSIKIADMSDSSFYARVLSGLEFENSVLDFYAGVKKTSIKSYVTLEPSDAPIISAALQEFGNLDLKRDEKTIFGGFNYALSYKSFIFEGGYEYLKIFGRSFKLNATDDNHIFNGAITKIVTDDFKVFIGGKAMLNQFNGVIPYLYNEYTKHRYDKKYGYAKVGFIYNFNLNSF